MTYVYTIYRIYFSPAPNHQYIGATCKSHKSRLSEHKGLLKRGKHHAQQLQHLYNKHGIEKMCFEIISTGNGTNHAVRRFEDEAIQNSITEGVVILNKKSKSGYANMAGYSVRKRRAKKRMSDRASRAAHARWDAYHATLADEPLPADLPRDMFRITVENLVSGKTHVLLFHPTSRVNRYDIDVDGKYWTTAGFSAAIARIRKSCAKMRRSG